MDIFSITIEALGCLTGLFLFLFDTAYLSLTLSVFPLFPLIYSHTCLYFLQLTLYLFVKKAL